MTSSVRMLAGGAALVVALAGLAACGSKPSSGGSSSGSTSTSSGAATGTGSSASGSTAGGSSSTASGSNAAGNGKGCLVTDTGGVDDRSFNASALKGLQDAKSQGITVKYLESKESSDYDPNISAFISQKCGLIVTVGFLMGDVTLAKAKANPTQDFAIVDYSYKNGPKNLKALFYDTSQAGFLAGYLAAGMTKTGVVATYGGQKLPTVTIYMDGFADGVNYYNAKHGKHVMVLGWNEKSQQGSFTNNFTDQTKGKQVTEQFMQHNADIIFPVAGNVGLGTASAVKQDGHGKVSVIWVDQDGCTSAPQYCNLFLSSAVKGVATSVEQAAVAAKSGTFTGGNYVGTLANNGVGIAPYHDFASKVPSSLKSEITQLKADIIAGKIRIASPSSTPQG